jgi:hypothetical protein
MGSDEHQSFFFPRQILPVYPRTAYAMESLDQIVAQVFAPSDSNRHPLQGTITLGAVNKDSMGNQSENSV